MTDPTPDTPPTLVERLRNTASYLAAGCVLPAKPDDGSDEPPDPVDDVTFEVEELRDLANLYSTAADALQERQGEIARLGARLANELSAEETRKSLLTILGPEAPAEHATAALSLLARIAAHRTFSLEESNKTLRETVALQEQALAMLQAQADPPNRAPLLASLEELTGPEMASACGNEVVQILRDAIAAIRTDARIIEAAREKLKGWHAWARKLGRAEGDEYASAMPATLQARISGQVEAGQLALLVAQIRRRVELTLALCADMGLGGPEAAELAPKAALWTDAEVAEIEAFRTRDWSGTKVNPFDHLPPALERTIYPGPGGRRAYFKRAGDPLPEPTEAAAERQLGLPGLPKPETAMRLRLALIDKPDGPLSALVAGFAQSMLDALDAAKTSPEALNWLVIQGAGGTVVAHGPYTALQQGRPRRLSLVMDQVDRDILAAKPEDRTDVLLDGLQRHMEAQGPTTADSSERFRKREFFRALQDSETARDHHADLRHAMGHTARKPTSAEVEQTHTDLQRLAFGQQHSSDLNALHAVLTSLLNAEPALDLEVFPVDPTTGEHKMEGEGGLEMAARLLTLARQRGAFDQRPVPSDPPSPPGYTPWISMGNSGWALDGVRVADDVIGAWAHYAGLWTRWARELAGCSDGTDEELRGFIGRLVARMHAMRTRNITAFDHGAGKPWAPAWEADSMGRIVFYADGRDATVDRLMLRVDADGFGLWVGDRLGLLVENMTIEEVARLYPLVAATLADYKADRLVQFDVMHAAAAELAAR